MIRQYEVGQAAAMYFTPPEGVASSTAPNTPTITIYTPGGSTLVSAGAATAPSASATVTALEGADTVTASSTTGFAVGDTVWISTSTSGRGYVDVLADVGTSTLVLQTKLKFALTSGYIKANKITYSLSSTLTGSIRRGCRAVWRYYIGGAWKTETQVFDIVKFPFSIPITEADVERAYANYGDLSGGKGQYQRYMDQAAEDIYLFLRGHQVYPDLCMERQLLVSACVYRTLALRHIGNQELFERYQQMYDQNMSNFLQSRTWYDDDEDMQKYEDSSEEANSAKAKDDQWLPPRYARVC